MEGMERGDGKQEQTVSRHCNRRELPSLRSSPRKMCSAHEFAGLSSSSMVSY